MIILGKMTYFPRHIRFYKNWFSSHRRRILKDTTNQNLPVCIILGGSSFSLGMFRSIACTTAAGLLKNKKGHIQRHFLEPKYKKHLGQTCFPLMPIWTYVFIIRKKKQKYILVVLNMFKTKGKDTWVTSNNIIPVPLFH